MLTRLLRKLNHHRTTELYFVGYPKTGNTWVRFMLGRYVQLMCDMEYRPLFDATDAWGRCERACVGPAMHFTHRPLSWETQSARNLDHDNVVRPFRGKRVVLITRHPLDTLVSLWMQRSHRGGTGHSGSLPEMLDDPAWGLDKFMRFHALWNQHRGDVRAFHLLRYEDLRTDPLDRFRALLAFLGIHADDPLIEQAVSEADFDNMRRIETAGTGPAYRSSGLSIFATGDTNNPDAFHVRRGKVGGYADYLDASEIARHQASIDASLPEFYGYGSPRTAQVHV